LKLEDSKDVSIITRLRFAGRERKKITIDESSCTINGNMENKEKYNNYRITLGE
jgi:hypothetical protein